MLCALSWSQKRRSNKIGEHPPRINHLDTAGEMIHSREEQRAIGEGRIGDLDWREMGDQGAKRVRRKLHYTKTLGTGVTSDYGK